jgi:hypothetical protein
VADYTTPPTFDSGDFLTAAQMNAYVRDNVAWIRDAMSRGPYYAAGGVVAGSSISVDNIMDITTIPPPAYPYRMTVIATGTVGANGSANQVWLRLVDRITENQLTQSAGMAYSGFAIVDLPDADDHRSFSIAGYQEFAANDAAGWRLQYLVTASNVTIDCHAVTFITPVPD